MGALDAISNEFAREHSDRLWKQLVMAPANDAEPAGARTEIVVVFALAVLAADRVKVPAALRARVGREGHAVLPAQRRASSSCRCSRATSPGSAAWASARGWGWRAGFVAAVVYRERLSLRAGEQRHAKCSPCCTCRSRSGCSWASPTREAAGRRAPAAWTSSASRASCFIYYALIALGGGVLIAITMGMFEAIGIDGRARWSSSGCCRAGRSAR